MKNMKEAEMLTGISAQNIRYYEKQGLLKPERNEKNSYREYDEEDINRLKMIKLFRKIGMPVSEIRCLLEGDIALKDAVEKQEKRLKSQRNEVNDALGFCKKIKENQLADMQVDDYLEQVAEAEKKGSVFMQFVNDYKEIIVSESVREFSFMPDTRCDTAEEFAEELLKYAAENKLSLIISKKSMSPHFFLNGAEYRAYRTSSRYGIVIHCELCSPKDYMPNRMSVKKYKKYRIISVIALPLLVFLATNLHVFIQLDFHEPSSWLTIFVIVVLFAADLSFLYYSYGKNFKG